MPDAGSVWLLLGPPLPSPLDSGLRRNDEWEAETTSGGAVECGHNRGRATSSRIGVRDMLSYELPKI